MVITKPTYIVAELPDDLASWVEAVRERFEPAIAHMPQEITLAGSSGVGPLVRGQDIADVHAQVEAAVADKTDFLFRLVQIGNFEQTDIYFVEPERNGFLELHHALKASRIAFENNPFPYHPHCSLKGFTPLRPGEREALTSLPLPSGTFRIRCVSIYEMDGMNPRKL